MKNKILKQIIIQIKKYDLGNAFDSGEEFKKWAANLNDTQIENFLSLNIDLEEIKELRHLLVNTDLLSCKDYVKKVNAISKLKNGDGCWHLYNNICNPNFLKSKNFYKDIDMLSRADTARYGLWILSNNDFINSPYHDEDLKLLVEAHDVNEERGLDFIVSEAIATVAENIFSIRSPYHQDDMKLIASSGSDCLQSSHSYPHYSLNNLAVNKFSLADKYHLENMKILSTNPVAKEFLYTIMTEPLFINGKYYRQEVMALVNAKSRTTARALYYYIVNPRKKYVSDIDYFNDYEYDTSDPQIFDRNFVAGSKDPDYLNNLIKINDIDDDFIMHYVALLMNPTFLNSAYKKADLDVLHGINDKDIFMDLYRVMADEDSLKSAYHVNAVFMISQTKNKDIRKLLVDKSTDELSLNSSHYAYDIEYISKLDLENIDKVIYKEMEYYLFRQKGIEDLQHKEKLEKLLQGEIVERSYKMSTYLDDIQAQIDNSNTPVIESTSNKSSNAKVKILRMFNKKSN